MKDFRPCQTQAGGPPTDVCPPTEYSIFSQLPFVYGCRLL